MNVSMTQDALRKKISRYFQVDGKAVYVLDNLFKKSLITNMEVFLNNTGFTLSDYDTEITKQVRHWKTKFSIQEVERITLLSTLQTAANILFKNLKLQFRVAQANLHMYGDSQNVHMDSNRGVTALYFANSDWQENWFGETIFYNNCRDPLFTVAPKPGRVVVFRGDILHRAGVPSRECFKPRLTIALKFDANSAASAK